MVAVSGPRTLFETEQGLRSRPFEPGRPRDQEHALSLEGSQDVIRVVVQPREVKPRRVVRLPVGHGARPRREGRDQQQKHRDSNLSRRHR